METSTHPSFPSPKSSAPPSLESQLPSGLLSVELRCSVFLVEGGWESSKQPLGKKDTHCAGTVPPVSLPQAEVIEYLVTVSEQGQTVSVRGGGRLVLLRPVPF